MSSKDGPMRCILSLHDRIALRYRHDKRSVDLRRIDRFMTNLKRVGFVKNIGSNGKEARYFLIEGRSWQKACRQLHATVTPSFVLWAEAEFLAFLESELTHRHPSECPPSDGDRPETP